MPSNFNEYGQQLVPPDWVNNQSRNAANTAANLGIELPNYPTAAAANAGNLGFTRGAINSDPVFGVAKGLLDPNNATANWDVARHGAEHAVGGGMMGSGIAGAYTANLNQRDIERRAALGSQLLSSAYRRTPPPVDPYAQSHGQFQNAQLLSQILNRYGNMGGGSAPTVMGGGGGGKSAPVIIGGNTPGMPQLPQFPAADVYGSGGTGWSNLGNQWGSMMNQFSASNAGNNYYTPYESPDSSYDEGYLSGDEYYPEEF